jgi:hypothetical protein
VTALTTRAVYPGLRIGELTVTELLGTGPKDIVIMTCSCGTTLRKTLATTRAAVCKAGNSRCKSCQRAKNRRTSIIRASAIK